MTADCARRCTPKATDKHRNSGPRAAWWLTALAAALSACQSVGPPKAGADWRIEPLMRLTNSAETAEGYYTLGRYYQGQNRLLPAVNAYRHALRLDPRHAEAHNAIGAIAGAQGRFDEAISAFDAALAVAPAAPHILSNLGHALTLAGRHLEAVPVLQRAAQLDPTNGTTRLNLAVAVSRGGAADAQGTNRNANREVASDKPANASMADLAPETGLKGRRAAETALGTVAGPVPVPAVELVTESSSSARKRWVQVGASELELRDVGETSTALDPRDDPGGSAPHLTAAYRLEVVNGNGVNGAGARVGEWLERNGAPKARLRNQRPYVQAATVIYFKRGFEPQAQRLSSDFGGLAVQIKPAALQDADVRILIGRDLVPILARALPPPRPVDLQAGATLRADRDALAGDDLKL
jgi:tetratricopeptide (TPR) repeat protein